MNASTHLEPNSWYKGRFAKSLIDLDVRGFVCHPPSITFILDGLADFLPLSCTRVDGDGSGVYQVGAN